MLKSITEFAKSAKDLSRNPLGIIALFIVLVYAIAALVILKGDSIEEFILILVLFMALFPVIVFIGFYKLVANHHNKLYGPSDFRDEENFIRAQKTAAALSLAITSKNKKSTTQHVSAKHQEKIQELFSRKNYQELSGSNHVILWVDDNPNNNIFERMAFEAQGISFRLAENTEDAIRIFKSTSISAIISDMGRTEGEKEGYVLLEKIREINKRVPFFIYAGSDSDEHNKMTKKRGGNGTTNKADKLFEMVMNAIK